MPNVYNLDEALKQRTTIDANWSKKKKIIVGMIAGVVAVSAASAGVWLAIEARPLPMPRSADEAIRGMASARFDRLSDERKASYREEASRLMRDLSPEARRAMFSDERTREAMGEIMRARMAETVRAMARGETPDWGQRGFMRPPPGERPPEGEAGERPPMQRPDPQQMRDRMMNQFASGDAQTSALMGEMFKRFGRGGGPMRGRGPR